jgi:hypothetical protein
MKARIGRKNSKLVSPYMYVYLQSSLPSLHSYEFLFGLEGDGRQHLVCGEEGPLKLRPEWLPVTCLCHHVVPVLFVYGVHGNRLFIQSTASLTFPSL